MGDMDSGNSGSLLSSSTGGGGGGGGGGDDQEFESSQSHHSSSSMSGFFNPTSMCMLMPGFVNTVPFQLNSLTTFSCFDGFDPPTFSQSCPGTNFMITHNNTNNNNTNNNNNNDHNSIDMGWPNKFGSIKQTNPMSISSSSSSFLDDTNCTTGLASTFTPTNNSNQQLNTGVRTNRVRPASGESSPRASDHSGTGPGRNPKKRSRATRKTPTTVLTTDTNNFRQMVQEFTGIPAPPFATFPGRTRVDLFGGLGNGHGCSGSSPPYLFTPFPQKIVPRSSLPAPIPVQPCSFAPTSMSSATDTLNPVLTFQSLLQQPLSYDSMASVGPKATDPSLNQLTSAHTAAAAASTATTTTMSNVTSVFGGGNNPSSVLEHTLIPNNRHGDRLGSYFNDGNGTNTVMSVNGTGHGGVARTEGMVDTWICSSD